MAAVQSDSDLFGMVKDQIPQPCLILLCVGSEPQPADSVYTVCMADEPVHKALRVLLVGVIESAMSQ